MKKHRLYVLTAALVLGTGFLFWSYSHSPRIREIREPATSKLPQEGEPWNGGKVRAPVRMTAGLSGRVEPDTFHDFTVSFSALEDCTQISSRIRGIDGVLVQDESLHDHGPCQKGQTFTRNGTLRVPSGIAGFYVVDIEFRNGDQVMGSSRSFTVQTTNEAPRKKLGDAKLSRDEAGNPIVILKSEESPAP